LKKLFTFVPKNKKMKAFYKILIFFGLIASIMFFNSCSKTSTESKLEGKWKYINVANIRDTNYVEDWEFLPNGILRIHYRSYEWSQHADSILRIDTARYEMDSYDKFTVSDYENGHLPGYNTQWQIVLNSDNALRIVNNAKGGLYSREFVKE
jgi:hypothetical protein